MARAGLCALLSNTRTTALRRGPNWSGPRSLMARAGLCALCGLFLVGIGLSAADWKDTKFPNWSEPSVLQVLTDSPWSHARTVKFAWHKREQAPLTYKDVAGADHAAGGSGVSPTWGIGAPKRSSLPDKANILVRWVSALPVRHATALYKQRDEKLDPGAVNALIPAPEADYVLELFGLPAEMAHQGAGMVERLVKDNSSLQLKSGLTVRPTRVEGQLQGLTLNLRIHFPSSPPITASDQEMEFSTDLQICAIREKFRLAAMTYLGRVEL